MTPTQNETLSCSGCGESIRPDEAIQGVDWSRGLDIETGDWPWTEDYYCPACGEKA